ncbi:MAG: sulfotransferase domain-containing protein [Actinomycetia bacterium]|nr:sulfotransferase domain-containing protein [Actinomycetes bacterium]
MKPIVWLASYPKSGNTWFRTFLANLLRDDEDPVDINELRTGSIASARNPFDIHTGLEASDLTQDEIDLLRPGVYRRMAEMAERTGHHKVHDAYTLNRDGMPLFPADATLGAVYLVRNPLDVTPSYAHHSARDAAWATEALCDPSHTMSDGPKRLHTQFRQILGTWSDHVRSWLDEPPFPVEVMRYEDMHLDAEATFTRATRACGLDHSAEQIREAIARSSFDEVKGQEREKGFGEKMPMSESFFRKGRIGSWRESLTDEQADRIVTDHAEMMRRLGYLEGGAPVF